MPLEHNKLKEAISKAVEVGKGRRFKQSVEMIVVLRDIDPKSQAGKIREIVVLPKGRGKKQKICVVADGELAEKAKSAGAFMVISSAELGSIGKKQAKKIASSCDWVLVRTDLMAQVGRVLGPALGPVASHLFQCLLQLTFQCLSRGMRTQWSLEPRNNPSCQWPLVRKT